MFEKAKYIKPDIPFERDQNSPSLLMRKTFFVESKPKKAILSAVGLGIGYFYINGKPVSLDLFTAPVSDYNKTVWYYSYDVTEALQIGENVVAAELGNGMFNEGVISAWGHQNSVWRDNPKMILKLDIDGKTEITSDESFVFSTESPTVYNQLRIREIYDSRLYKDGWNRVGFDDSDWKKVAVDVDPPKGVFRVCPAEGIRECEEYLPVSIKQVDDSAFIYDFGQNMSGYARITANIPSGKRLVLRYSEWCEKDGSLHIENFYHYKEHSDIVQCDEFIGCGKEFTYSPKFTYHGFRFLQIDGVEKPIDVKAIFVHQDIKRRSDFCCSNEELNRLFECGIKATWSNMFYMPTDCPTREKMGWCNDAQSSAEQFMTNFYAEDFFKKWYRDILDSMRDDGALPCVVPTYGWGFEKWNGPVCEGILFEVPYRVWLHTGNCEMFKEGLPYFEKYFNFLEQKAAECDLSYGLCDWAALTDDRVSNTFINHALRIKFYGIAALGCKANGLDSGKYESRKVELTKEFKARFLEADGRCSINRQTAVALVIWLGLYDNLIPLKSQLSELVKAADFHHDCGMVGIRYLFEALNMCGLQEYAYKILTAKGIPSYVEWIKDGATTLYEFWDMKASKNHHMYSDFMQYLMKNAVGINDTFEKFTISPCYFEDLDFAKGRIEDVFVEWCRKDGAVELIITVPEGKQVEYKNDVLSVGTHKYIIKG